MPRPKPKPMLIAMEHMRVRFLRDFPEREVDEKLVPLYGPSVKVAWKARRAEWRESRRTSNLQPKETRT